MNMKLASRVIEELLDFGVEEFICCAGARNAPFVELLSQSPQLKTTYHFEERSAGFFGIGKMHRSEGRPVAVFTTSGTAVAELLPAVIESHYLRMPLIVVSADRPKSYRGSGAPQTIEQTSLFGKYVSRTFDLSRPDEELPLSLLSCNNPIHINVCFDEPLIEDFSVPSWSPAPFLKPHLAPLQNEDLERIKFFFKSVNCPLVIVNSLDDVGEQDVVAELLKLNAPIYLEGASGLFGVEKLRPLLICEGEREVREHIDQGTIDGILRIGGVPTCRIWRDLEDRYAQLPILSLSNRPFSGLSRQPEEPIPFQQFLEVRETVGQGWERNFKDGRELSPEFKATRLVDLFQEFPGSEVAMMHLLQEKISPNDSVFVGNSLPIRSWDLSAPLVQQRLPAVYANRGTNGIDGLLSTGLGLVEKGQRNWIVLGDLSTLYDFSALTLQKDLQGYDIKVVVINNSGGKIFQRIFNSRHFENRHDLCFEKWAELFSWEYQQLHPGQSLVLANRCEVIEMIPSNLETEEFWKGYGS